MLEKLIRKSTNYLIYYNVIDKDDREIYEYGFHSLYNNIIDITSIVIISLLLGQVSQTIFYHISFILLRNFAGGFHAKTHRSCFIMSTAIWLISLWGISNYKDPLWCITLSTVSVILIWFYAPIEHSNNPLNEEKRGYMRVLSRTLSTFFLIIVIFIFFLAKDHSWIAVSIAYGMASHTILLLAALSSEYVKSS